MEEYEILMKKALDDFKKADHMIYVTYPLVNDPKIVGSIVERLYSALKNTINAVLSYDYLYKRINEVPDKLNEKLELFKKIIGKRYNFDRNIILLIDDLDKIVQFKNKSPVEFVRRENLVICSSNYSTKTINLNKVKGYVNQSKDFIHNASRLLIKNGF